MQTNYGGLRTSHARIDAYSRHIMTTSLAEHAHNQAPRTCTAIVRWRSALHAYSTHALALLASTLVPHNTGKSRVTPVPA